MFTVEGLRPILFGPYDFSLSPGECLVVSGPSGSGKSLLLRALADLDPSSGRIFLNSHERNDMPASHWRRKVRYVAAEPGWWGDTAKAHFNDADAIMSRLAQVGLDEDVMSRDITHLSTGERQRLAILRAIEGQPDILLLDEPTAALDRKSARDIEALLKAELTRGGMLVLVTHSQAQAQRFATQTIKLKGSKRDVTAKAGAA